MEIFILDALLRPIDLIDPDNYISMIWTERFAAKGDFELVTLSTNANRNRFVEDTLLMIPDSKRIMRVNTIDDTDDEERGATLTVKGYELVSILEQRVSASKASGTHEGMLLAVTYFNGWTPLDLINDMVWRICIPTSTWALSPGDNIPFLNDWHTTPGSLYPPGDLPEPAPVDFVWGQKIDTLYNAVKDVADSYDVGFRLYKDPNATKLYFESYVGNDRTSRQTNFPPVVFSSDMANLQNTKEYKNNLAHFNLVIAVYVYKNPDEGGYPPDLTLTGVAWDPDLDYTSGGFEQKSKYIPVTQLPDGMTDPYEIAAYLEQVAREDLTRSRPSDIFDGEVSQNSDFVYERDYNLGDLVEVRANNGGAAYMRVAEYIIKYDTNGKASYPSLETKTSITPGTWASWKYDVNWVDMGSGEYWNNQ